MTTTTRTVMDKDNSPALASTPRRRAPWPWALGLVAGGWLLSGLAHLVHADWLSLVVLLLGTASVLRVGRGVLDRMMFAVLVVGGALLTGGLLFSVWPWGLHPVPVAGTLLTALVAVGWFGRRRPSLQVRFDPSDLVVLGTGLFAFWATFHPLRRVSGAGRFLFTTLTEDRYVHFALFETIHRLGGYAFLHQDAARISLPTPTEAVYPSGSHYLYAVLDVFFRSTTDVGPTVAAYDRFFVFALGGYAFMALAIVWAARWIARSAVRGWRLFLVTSVVGALLVAGHLTPVLLSGFDSEVLALAFVALTAAVVVRPPRLIGERVLVFGSCLVLVAYTYYLFLPFAALGVVLALWLDRRRILPAWRPVLVGAVLFGAVTAVPLWFAVTSTLDPKAQAVAVGARVHPSTSLTLGLALALLALLGTSWVRRSVPVRTLVGQVIAGSTLVGVFGAYQVLAIGTTSYYFDKLLTCLFVVCVVSMGILAAAVRPLAPVRGSRWSAVREPVLGLVGSVSALTLLAGIQWGLMAPSVLGDEWKQTLQGKWYDGAVTSPRGPVLRGLAAQGLLADSVPTLFLCTNRGDENWRISLLNSALNRNMGALIPSITPVMEMPVGGQPAEPAVRDKAVAAVLRTVEASKVPLRFVVHDPSTAEAVRRALQARPELRATVVSGC
ncbi:hypothetical protein R8Z50_29020 [Longispora sp. K20-0274]|uniref:hypothetical protein n=1 Tax=Longispora sp. K20-0274 TaxID=3088255 RepID=UPI00399BBAFA